MSEGVVVRYSEDKGLGFICQKDGTEVFVERSSLDMHGFKTLNIGDRVTYEVEKGVRGFQAKRVRKLAS